MDFISKKIQRLQKQNAFWFNQRLIFKRKGPQTKPTTHVSSLISKEDISSLDAKDEGWNEKIKVTHEKATKWLKDKATKFHTFFQKLTSKATDAQKYVYQRYQADGEALFRKAEIQLETVKDEHQSWRKEVLYDFINKFQETFGGVDPDATDKKTEKKDFKKTTKYEAENLTTEEQIKYFQTVKAPEASIQALIKATTIYPNLIKNHPQVFTAITGIYGISHRADYIKKYQSALKVISTQHAQLEPLLGDYAEDVFSIIPLTLNEVTGKSPQKIKRRMRLAKVFTESKLFENDAHQVLLTYDIYREQIKKILTSHHNTWETKITDLWSQVKENQNLLQDPNAQEVINHMYKWWKGSSMWYNRRKAPRVFQAYLKFFSEDYNQKWLKVKEFRNQAKQINSGDPKTIQKQLFDLQQKWLTEYSNFDSNKYTPVVSRIWKIEKQFPGVKLAGRFKWYRGDFNIDKFIERKTKTFKSEAQLTEQLHQELRYRVLLIAGFTNKDAQENSTDSQTYPLSVLKKIYAGDINTIKSTMTNHKAAAARIEKTKAAVAKQQAHFQKIHLTIQRFTKTIPSSYRGKIKPASKQKISRIYSLSVDTHLLSPTETKTYTKYPKEIIGDIKKVLQDYFYSNVRHTYRSLKLKPNQKTAVYDYYINKIRNATTLTELANTADEIHQITLNPQKAIAPLLPKLSKPRALKPKEKKKLQSLQQTYSATARITSQISRSRETISLLNKKLTKQQRKTKAQRIAKWKKIFKDTSTQLSTAATKIGTSLSKKLNDSQINQLNSLSQAANAQLAKFIKYFAWLKIAKGTKETKAAFETIEQKIENHKNNPGLLLRLLHTLNHRQSLQRLTQTLAQAKKKKTKVDLNKHLAKAPTKTARNFPSKSSAHKKTMTVLDQNKTPRKGVNTQYFNLTRNDYYNKRIHEQFSGLKPGHDVIKVYNSRGRLISMGIAMEIKNPRHGDPKKGGITIVNIWGRRKGKRMYLLSGRYYEHTKSSTPQVALLKQATNARRTYIARVTGGKKKHRLARRRTIRRTAHKNNHAGHNHDHHKHNHKKNRRLTRRNHRSTNPLKLKKRT